MEYLIASALGWIVWLVFYLPRKDLRNQMLVMSVLLAPMAFIDLFIVPEYWIPATVFGFPGSIEGLMFFFQLGGVASVSYEVVKSKKLVKIKKYKVPWVYLLVMAILFAGLIVIGSLLPVNPILVLILLLYLLLALMLRARQDLVRLAITNGIIFGLIYFLTVTVWFNLFPNTQSWFTLIQIPRIFILRVPVYEIILGIGSGAFIGSFYEFVLGYKHEKF